MNLTFDSLVDEVKKLSLDEKEELEFLLERFLLEEGRKKIYKNHQKSLQELKKGDLEFSSDINRLKSILK